MVWRLAVILLVAVTAAAATPRLPRPAPTIPPTFDPPPILMYHRVDPERASDPTGRELTVSPDQFEAQLAYLQSRGLTAISMQQLRERLQSGASLDHVVVLTFDDGYADQYTYALPLLHRFGDTATFYIITGNVGTPRHLTWDQLSVMQSLGQDIAAHGMVHDDLSVMSPIEQARQIDNSIELLRTKLHAPVGSYGYPSGRFNRTTLELVRQAGIDFAVTTDPTYVIPPETRFELPRLRVRGDWRLGDFAQAIQIALHRLHVVRR